jgi:hypothetical protein
MKPLTHEQELAFYHNSYPIATEHTPVFTSNLKIAALAVTSVETFTFFYVGYNAYTFTLEHGHESLIQLGSTAHLFISGLKAFIALELHQHADRITDRTP